MLSCPTCWKMNYMSSHYEIRFVANNNNNNHINNNNNIINKSVRKTKVVCSLKTKMLVIIYSSSHLFTSFIFLWGEKTIFWRTNKLYTQVFFIYLLLYIINIFIFYFSTFCLHFLCFLLFFSYSFVVSFCLLSI